MEPLASSTYTENIPERQHFYYKEKNENQIRLINIKGIKRKRRKAPYHRKTQRGIPHRGPLHKGQHKNGLQPYRQNHHSRCNARVPDIEARSW